MQMIYRFRIILDTHEDVFRDLEIEAEANLEDFHNAITQAFGFEGGEMASFNIYLQIDRGSLFQAMPGPLLRWFFPIILLICWLALVLDIPWTM